ncbi:DinB family protein [Amycolatopsis minnesotensis]|uniref:DinB family protein n=1 Tax=Amycolatopsis minnesotensis TaxID=337894 RepID=A0ABP5DQA9_9PSEU
MTDFSGEDLGGSAFERVNLSGARFENVRANGARFRSVDLSGASFRGAHFGGVVMSGAILSNVDIRGEIDGLRVNGVDVGPLIEAELDRRHPERAKMRPTDPDGFREAWAVLERLWYGTVERARGLDPVLLHESVGGEWSFIETLRHLVFVTDAWVRRAILGDPAPWDALGLPWDEAPELPGVPWDRSARPSLDTVLALRRDRMATVREVIGGLTEQSLAADTEPVEGPGWPEPGSHPVRECLRCVLNEEWEHRLYAERDLDALFARQG